MKYNSFFHNLNYALTFFDPSNNTWKDDGRICRGGEYICNLEDGQLQLYLLERGMWVTIVNEMTKGGEEVGREVTWIILLSQNWIASGFWRLTRPQARDEDDQVKGERYLLVGWSLRSNSQELPGWHEGISVFLWPLASGRGSLEDSKWVNVLYLTVETWNRKFASFLNTI